MGLPAHTSHPLFAVRGRDFGGTSDIAVSRFLDMPRQIEKERVPSRPMSGRDVRSGPPATLIDSNARCDLPNKKIDVADAQHGGIAPRYREQVVLVEKKATSQKQAGFEQDLTAGTERKPQFGPETTQRRFLLFSPERQTIAGVPGEFESQLTR